MGIQDRRQRGEADSCFHIRKYKRTRACPEASGEYHHILQTDGYQAYEKLEGITHMGCWAHCHRKYKEALDSAPAENESQTNCQL